MPIYKTLMTVSRDSVMRARSRLETGVTAGRAELHLSPRHSQYNSLMFLVPVRATQPSSGRPPVAHVLTIRWCPSTAECTHQSINQSINQKSLCSIATSRLKLLHNAVWQSRWWDQMMRSGYDWLKSHDLRCRRNDVNDWADVVSAGRAFQMRGAATEKARLPTVESLTEGTMHKATGAGRTQCPPALYIGDWNQRTQVSRSAPM